MSNIDFTNPDVKNKLRELSIFVYTTHSKYGQYSLFINADKNKLMWLSEIVVDYFNKCEFKTKSNGTIKWIECAELCSYNTAIYFRCKHMNNFTIYGGSKKGTFMKLVNLLVFIMSRENDDYFDIKEFNRMFNYDKK